MAPRTTDARRVALIGYGLAGAAFHAPLVHATPGLELAAVVTGDPDRRAQAQDRYPGARLLASAEEIWSEPDGFDLVVVAAPNRAHLDLALRSVEGGMAVVVDKPLATTSADAIRLRDAAAERVVPVAVFQNRRWDGDFLTARELIERGALGSVHTFESRFDRWRPTVHANAWRESPDPADGGGLLFDLGSHLIDQALTLFGPAESVAAEVRQVRRGAQVDDDVFVALHHRSGTVSHLGASMVVADPGPRLRVLGTDGAYVKFGLDGQEARLREGADPGAPDWGREPESDWGRLTTTAGSEPVPTVAGAYPRFYALVADALETGGPMPVGIDDAIASLRVIEAARTASAEGVVVRL